MNRTEKETFVEELRSRVEKAPVFYLADFTGLDVKAMTALRAQLKAQGAEFVVVKNRLAKLALADTELPDITEALSGPTGVVFGYEGVVEPAKVLSDFAKEHDDKPVFKAAVLENEVLGAEQINALAKLPPKEVLMSQLAGALEGPLSAFVAALEGKIQEMAGLLEALRQEREAS
jgi:large subunit ribosomal protein L10